MDGVRRIHEVMGLDKKKVGQHRRKDMSDNILAAWAKEFGWLD